MLSSRLIKKVSILLSMTALVGLYQNCGTVETEFDNDEPSAELSSELNTEQINDNNVSDMAGAFTKQASESNTTLDLSATNDLLKMNSACRSMNKAIDTSTHLGDLRLAGTQTELDIPYSSSVRISGIVRGNVNVGKSDLVYISGISDNVTVQSAKELRVSGRHKDICVKANNLLSLAGSNGTFDGHVTIIGDESYGSRPTGGSVTGITSSDLTIIDMDVRVVSGSKKNVYLVDSNVQYLSGITGDIYIYGGTVKRISGSVGNIHLFNGARIETITGTKKNLIIH